MAPLAGPHRHRNTTKVNHKPFKSRHASKSTIRDLSKGRIEKLRLSQRHKTLHQQVMSKIDRKHQARQRMQMRHQEHAQTTSIFAGPNGAPRIVAVVPLNACADPKVAVQCLSRSVDLDPEITSEGTTVVRVDRFKQSLHFVLSSQDLLRSLDACKAADFIIFVLHAREKCDKSTEVLLKAIESQGISNVLTVVQSLDTIEPQKRRSRAATSLKDFMSRFFPSQDKLHSLEAPQDCANVIRSLCTSTPKGVRWRDERSWLLVESVDFEPRDSSQLVSLRLTGVVRGKGLKANRLLQIGDFGPFQIEDISSASIPRQRKRKVDDMVTDEAIVPEILERPDDDRDDTDELAPEDIKMDEVREPDASEAHSERKGVLLDDHHYFSDEEKYAPQISRRVPKGTSAYQAAWYLEGVSDSGSDLEEDLSQDDEMSIDSPALPQDGTEGLDKLPQRDPTEIGTEYPQSEAFLDPSPTDEAEQMAAYRSSRRGEADEDLEFPDEIELHPNVLARERLARYRGLKSLRTSHWDESEDKPHEPENWNRLLQVPDYRGAKSKVTGEALVGGVKPGTRVQIHIKDFPISKRESLLSSRPLTVYSLLRHENKRTAMNFSITLHSDLESPIKSKEELVLQCGPRRMIINPLFSDAGITSNDVHKFDRFLHPGRTAIATFIGPMTWGSVPALFFRRASPSSDTLELIGTGASMQPSSSRVIAKRIILTGHPYKIHKRLVTVRYMFFNAEDVQWFKALQLWTRHGRSGFIKESLGTHGYFKSTFDGRINPQDAVGMSLYKRVWPRQSLPFNGASLQPRP